MKKKVFFIPVALMGMTLVACGESKPTPETYTVTCATEGVTLTNTKATKGEKYVTSIGLTEEIVAKRKILPEVLESVTVGGTILENYTYTLEDNKQKADFEIPSESVLGNIEIKLSLVEPEPLIFTAKLEGTEVMELSNTSAIEGIDYSASISVIDGYEDYCTVPETLTEVNVGGHPLASYTYFVDKDGIGQLTIIGEDVTGDIIITAKAVGNPVSVSVTDTFIKADKNEATVGSSFSTTLRISDEDYSFPDELNEDGVKEETKDQEYFDLSPYCIYTKVDRHTATLSIPATYGEEKEILIWGNITIGIKAIKDTVVIKNGTLQHLKTDIGDKKIAPKNKDFTFNLEVVSDTDATYEIPDSLKIYVGGSSKPLDRSGYGINAESKIKATVTIFAKSVTDNIVVSGDAKEEASTYEVTLVSYGVIIGGEPKATEGERYEAKITPEKGHQAPTEDNVRVYIGDLDNIKVDAWYIPNDKEYSGGITYDNAGALIIPGEIIDNTIVIVSCAPDISLLKKLDWEEISAVSDAGYAPYLFEVGEETNAFKIDGYEDEFTARILDFNRDAKEGEKKNPAGMTLEFTSCIKKVCFSSAECNDQNTYYYKDFYDKIYTSDMYNILNNEIYSKLPFKNQIKQVEKATLKGTKGGSDHSSEVQSSPNYLFPLSLKEMDAIPEQWMSAYENEVPYFKPEGAVYANQPYAYYKDRTQTVPNILRKKLGEEYANYWSRSPATDIRTPNIYGYIDSSDRMSQFGCRMTNSAIAPAFCI